MSNVTYAAETSTGLVRKNNEDAYVLRSIWKNAILAVAIDGVGGEEGGEVAASIAREAIPAYLEQYRLGDRLQILRQAVTHANNEIFLRKQKSPDLANMACVATALLLDSQTGLAYMVHVGDSRMYFFDKFGLRKVSHDHSPVGELEDNGIITEEQAMAHPRRNEIYRDLGSELHDAEDADFLEAQTFQIDTETDFLLCSDGLSDLVPSSQMRQVLSTNDTCERKVQSLVGLALKSGGKDNVTVVMVHYSPKQSPKIDPTKKEISSSNVSTSEKQSDELGLESTNTLNNNSRLYITAAAVLIILVCLLGWFIFQKRAALPSMPSAQNDDYAISFIESHYDSLLSCDVVSDNNSIRKEYVVLLGEKQILLNDSLQEIFIGHEIMPYITLQQWKESAVVRPVLTEQNAIIYLSMNGSVYAVQCDENSFSKVDNWGCFIGKDGLAYPVNKAPVMSEQCWSELKKENLTK